tara:strand:+ start:491 stop:787 length:297 start_codon:yes stop_codon:yes gene_type:complete
MGWWSITSEDNGPEMHNGDTPADIMGDAIEKIVKEYEEDWGRKPYRKELKAVFSSTSTLPQYYAEVGAESTPERQYLVIGANSPVGREISRQMGVADA